MQIMDFKVHSKILEILNLVKKVFPEAILAGGAVFDSLVGQSYRDLDIYILPASKEKISRFENLVEINHVSPRLNHQYGHDVIRIIDFRHKGVKCQLVMVEDIVAKVNRFDLTFRRITFDGTLVKVFPEALSAIQEKKLIVGSFHSPIKTLIRMVRFKKRYSDLGFDFDKETLRQLCLYVVSSWSEAEKILGRDCSKSLSQDIKQIIFRTTGSKLIWKGNHKRSA